MGIKEQVEFVLRLGGDLAEKAEEASTKITTLRGAASVALDGVGALSAGVISAGTAFYLLENRISGVIDTIGDLSAATGLSTDVIQGLRLAANATGGDLEKLVPSELPKKMAEAADGTGKAADAFDRLGVKVADSGGHLRSTDQVFSDTLNHLYQIEDPTARAALAMQTLGSAGTELLGTFEDVSDLDRFVSLAQEFGIQAGPEAAKAAAEWQAATAALDLAFENAGTALVDAFGGNATGLLNNFALGFVYLTELIKGLPHQFALAAAEIGQSWVRVWEAITDTSSTDSIDIRIAKAIDANLASVQAFASQIDEAALSRALEFFQGTGMGGGGFDFLGDNGGSTGGGGGVGRNPSFGAKVKPTGQTDQAEAIRAAELAGQVEGYQRDAAIAAMADQAAQTSASLDDLISTINAQQARGLGGMGDALMAALQGGGLSQLLGGGLSSVAGLAGGPVGGALQLALQIPDLIGKVAGFEERLITQFRELPESFAQALGRTLPQILDRLPDLADAILEAAVRLPQAITGSLPAIVSSFYSAIPALVSTAMDHLPEIIKFTLIHTLEAVFLGGPFTLEIIKGFAQGLDIALGGLPSRIAEAIGEVLARLVDPLRGPEGRVLGTDLTAAAGDKRLFGVRIPFLDEGSDRITRRGVAMLHEGERVSRAGEGGGNTFHFNVHAQDARDLMRQLRELLGPHGLGDSLAEFG